MIQVKAKKEFEVTIDGEDVTTLREVCRMARIHLNRGHCSSEPWLTEEQQIRRFLDEIFDKTQ